MLEISLNFLKLLEKIRTPFLNKLFQFSTFLGEETVLFIIIAFFFWCYNKKFGYKIGLSFFISGIFIQGLKVIFKIERPWILDSDIHPVESAVENATGYSFPSGHTSSATSLYGSFFYYFKNKGLKIISIFLFLLVGFSRMYLCVHTPLDVLTALIITFLIVLIINKFSDIILSENNILKVSLALGISSIILCIFSYILAKIGYIEINQINDCFKSGGAGVGVALGYYIERKYINFSTETKKMWHQIVKLAIGLIIAVALKSGLKAIAPDNLICDFVRYFITILWFLAIYPYIFTKVLNTQNSAKN